MGSRGQQERIRNLQSLARGLQSNPDLQIADDREVQTLLASIEAELDDVASGDDDHGDRARLNSLENALEKVQLDNYHRYLQVFIRDPNSENDPENHREDVIRRMRGLASDVLNEDEQNRALVDEATTTLARLERNTSEPIDTNLIADLNTRLHQALINSPRLQSSFMGGEGREGGNRGAGGPDDGPSPEAGLPTELSIADSIYVDRSGPDPDRSRPDPDPDLDRSNSADDPDYYFDTESLQLEASDVQDYVLSPLQDLRSDSNSLVAQDPEVQSRLERIDDELTRIVTGPVNPDDGLLVDMLRNSIELIGLQASQHDRVTFIRETRSVDNQTGHRREAIGMVREQANALLSSRDGAGNEGLVEDVYTAFERIERSPTGPRDFEELEELSNRLYQVSVNSPDFRPAFFEEGRGDDNGVPGGPVAPDDAPSPVSESPQGLGIAEGIYRYRSSTDPGPSAGRIPYDEVVTQALDVPDDVRDRVVARRREIDPDFEREDVNAHYLVGIVRRMEAGRSDEEIAEEFGVPPDRLRAFVDSNPRVVALGRQVVRAYGDYPTRARESDEAAERSFDPPEPMGGSVEPPATDETPEPSDLPERVSPDNGGSSPQRLDTEQATLNRLRDEPTSELAALHEQIAPIDERLSDTDRAPSEDSADRDRLQQQRRELARREFGLQGQVEQGERYLNTLQNINRINRELDETPRAQGPRRYDDLRRELQFEKRLRAMFEEGRNPPATGSSFPGGPSSSGSTASEGQTDLDKFAPPPRGARRSAGNPFGTGRRRRPRNENVVYL